MVLFQQKYFSTIALSMIIFTEQLQLRLVLPSNCKVRQLLSGKFVTYVPSPLGTCLRAPRWEDLKGEKNLSPGRIKIFIIQAMWSTPVFQSHHKLYKDFISSAQALIRLYFLNGYGCKLFFTHSKLRWDATIFFSVCFKTKGFEMSFWTLPMF